MDLEIIQLDYGTFKHKKVFNRGKLREIYLQLHDGYVKTNLFKQVRI